MVKYVLSLLFVVASFAFSGTALAYGGGYSSYSGGGSGLYVGLNGIYLMQYEDNTTNVGNPGLTTRTRATGDGRIGYKFDSVIHFGLSYVQDVYTTNTAFRETYTGYGAYVGLMWDNVDFTLSYLVNPTLHTDNMDQNHSYVWGASTDYAGNYGYAADLTYKFSLGSTVSIGPRLTYRYWEFKNRSQVGQVVNNNLYKYTTLYPQLALYIHF